METRNSYMRIVILVSFLAVIVIAGAFLIVHATSDSSKSTPNASQPAATKQMVLSDIKILDDQPTSAQGQTGGGAKATFFVSHTLQESQAEVARNLKKSDFRQTKEAVEGGDTKDTINWMTETYATDKNAIEVRYTFAETFQCTENQVCGPGKTSLPKEKRYDLSHLTGETVKSITVSYR